MHALCTSSCELSGISKSFASMVWSASMLKSRAEAALSVGFARQVSLISSILMVSVVVVCKLCDRR